MADSDLLRNMVRERDVAVGALEGFAARRALNVRGVSAPIQEENDLIRRIRVERKLDRAANAGTSSRA